MDEHYGSPPVPVSLKIKLMHSDFGELVASTWDMSDKGIFVLLDHPELLHVGMIVKGQVQSMMDDAPVIDMEVVRCEKDGIGLKFC